MEFKDSPLFRGLPITVEPCGSRVTCDPPPNDTDIDYLVEVHIGDDGHEIDLLFSKLERYGWVREGDYCKAIDAASFGFVSWRSGPRNLIVTASRAFAEKHRAATYICKRLNLMDKQDRIAVFQAVLYGNQWGRE